MEPRGERSLTRYAVAFRVAGVAPAAGALVVEEDRLLLEGRSPEGLVELSVPYAELSEVRVGRSVDERLNGRPTLLLSRKNGPLVQVEPFGVGLLHELGDLLAGLAATHPDVDEQVAVIVPLKRGRLARAKELVADGPPFDPAALGLTRHDVFLAPEEAVFVLCGDVAGNVPAVAQDLGGRFRVAEVAGHDVRAAHQQQAGLADAERLHRFGIDDADADAGLPPSASAYSGRRRVAR